MKYFWLGFFIFLSTLVAVYNTEIKHALLEKQQSWPKEQQLRIPEISLEARTDWEPSIRDLVLYRQKDRLFLKARLILGAIKSEDLKDASMVDVAAKTGRTLDLFNKDIEKAFKMTYVRIEIRNTPGFIIDSIDLYYDSDILPTVKKDTKNIFFEVNCNKASSLNLDEVATLTAVLRWL